MAIPDDVFVADAVTHSYNQAESNFRVPRYAEQISEIGMGLEMGMPEGYSRTAETFLSDWPIEDTENVVFRESPTDFAVFHPQTIMVYHDGLTSFEKAQAFVERNPTRSRALAGVDVVGSDDPQAELTRQVDALDAHGVKVYPSYWEDDGTHEPFFMDDPDKAFPLWEKCVDLGMDVVAVHKAIPFGKVATEPYKSTDVEDAAASFPELNFEIVHGGFAFAEETAHQITRFPNVYVNLEVTSAQLLAAPGKFKESIANLTEAGGEYALEKLIWATGASDFHPQPLLEAFWEFDFGELDQKMGSFEVTKEHKRQILGGNFCDAHRFDESALRSIEDEYNKPRELKEPFSTTAFETVAQ